MKRRFVSLSATEIMVLRTVQEELSGFKKKVTASDLREKVILRRCDLERLIKNKNTPAHSRFEVMSFL